MTDGIDRLTEGAKVEVVETQSATTPEEATSREYAKRSTLLMQVLPRAAQAARRACLLCVLSPPRC